MISRLWEIIQDGNRFATAPNARSKTIALSRKGLLKRKRLLPKNKAAPRQWW